MKNENIRHIALNIVKMREDLGYNIQDPIVTMPEIVNYINQKMDKDKIKK